jgi:dTDP-4-amino-4,6-dideoxygalactose transaminase
MLKEYLCADYALTCSSATAGLFMALKTLDLEPGDEVITSAMTFAASLNCIVNAGGIPVLVDVEPGTYNIDIDQLESAVTGRTRAIMPVHFAGLPVDLDRLYLFAQKRGIRVVEDAAHAIGSEYKRRRIGGFGDIQVFSFHPNKNMTTGEGGCVTTSDEETAERIKLLRFHGIDREAWARFAKDGSPHYDISLSGHKFNFMDMQAALGIYQLPRLDGFIERRTELVGNYYEILGENEAFDLPARDEDYDCRHAWHLFAPLVNTSVTGLSRDTFIEEMKKRNIGTGVHYRAVHLSSFYQSQYGFREGQFPNAEKISEHVVSLPLFPDLTDNDQQRVFEAIQDVFSVVVAK